MDTLELEHSRVSYKTSFFFSNYRKLCQVTKRSMSLLEIDRHNDIKFIVVNITGLQSWFPLGAQLNIKQ